MDMNIVISKKVTIDDVLMANTFKQRLFGYMFRKKPHHQALMIKPCNSIHTFFMKFSIDVAFLDEDNNVIEKINGLTPGRIIMPIKEAYSVIEAEEGVLEHIDIGDKLQLID